MMKSYGGRVTSTVTTRPLHGSGQRTGLTSFPVTLVSGWGKKQSAHQTGCSLTVCTPLQDLCLFLLSLLMFLHKHTQLDQSIPPMSCCLYDGVTRLPEEEKNSPSVTWRLITVLSFVMCVCVWVGRFWPQPRKMGEGWVRKGGKLKRNLDKKLWQHLIENAAILVLL